MDLKDDSMQEVMQDTFPDKLKNEDKVRDGVDSGGAKKADKGLPLSGGLAGRKSIMNADKLGKVSFINQFLKA